MATAPPLDLRPPGASLSLPANIDAEQALLGCLLYDNNAFHRFSDLQAAHFFEPLHQRLYEAISGLIAKGSLADPMLLGERFAPDPAYAEVGGLRYLADLVDRAPPSANAKDYAAEIIDYAQRRALIVACGDASKAADEDRETSGLTHIETLEQELFALSETQAARGFLPFATFATQAINTAAAAYQRDGGLAGLSTGLSALDVKLGGLHPSDLVIVAGRPSMGKTALATNIAFNIARNYAYEVQPDGSHRTIRGGRVGFFSLEMSGEQLAMRILADAAEVSSDRLRKGEVQPTEFGRVRDACIEVQAMPLYVDDSGGVSIAQVATRARRMKRTTGLDVVIVDYLQLLSGSKRYGGGERTQEVTEITVGLKNIAKELNVPVIALAQLSRAVEQREDKRPQLSDLRESGSIEQDADVVMFCFREEYYLSRTEPDPKTQIDKHAAWSDQMEAARGRAEIIIGKQRHGPIGTVRMMFNGELTRFSDAPPDHDYRKADPVVRNPAGSDGE
jgi:replicative DNA helicase